MGEIFAEIIADAFVEAIGCALSWRTWAWIIGITAAVTLAIVCYP